MSEMMLECTQKPMGNQNNTLKLVLTHKWYDMIEAGIKTEEYRDVTPYWEKRIGCTYWHGLHPDKHESTIHKGFCIHYISQLKSVQFQRAYPKNPPRMTKAIKLIRIGTGKPEWGAIEGELYFVIELI